MEEKCRKSCSLRESIKELLSLGRLLCIIPTRPGKTLTFSTVLIAVLLFFNAILEGSKTITTSKQNPLEISNPVRMLMFPVWGCFIYIHFSVHRNAFLKIFDTWDSNVHFDRHDKTLRRDTLLITMAVMFSAILENGVLHLNYFKDVTSVNGLNATNDDIDKTTLAVYFRRAHSSLYELLGYHPILAVYAFIVHKLTVYSWNFVDIAIAVFARAVYFRFKSLSAYVLAELVPVQDKNILDAILIGNWTKAVSDHKTLCRIVDCLDDLFSPLIFGGYTINMYYICIQLFYGIINDSSGQSLVDMVYLPWSFVHLVMRVLIVSICCARVNTHAHKFLFVLHECPAKFYATEVSRLEHRILSGPEIGLTGLGYFTVTKPFILSMFGVVITFEIVLLQCAPTPTVIC